MLNPKESLDNLRRLFTLTTRGYEQFEKFADDRLLYHTLCTRFADVLQDAATTVDTQALKENSRLLDFIYMGLRNDYKEIEAMKLSLEKRGMI